MRFNELLAARFNEMISALFGLAEQEGVHSVAPEIMPVAIAEGERIEHSFLKAERRCYGDINQGASVGNFGYAGLFVPASTGVIVTLERFKATRASAGTLVAGIIAPPGAATLLTAIGTTQSPRDARYVAQGTTAKMASGVNALGSLADAFGRTVNRGVAASTDSEFMVDGIVLFPGWAFVAVSTVANEVVTATATWRERAFLPEENP